MSDDFHRPTYTSANANNEPTNTDGHYNPTQVRLYGIPGKLARTFAGAQVSISAFNDAAQIRLDFSNPKKLGADIDHVIKVLTALKKDPKRATIEALAPWSGGDASEGQNYQLGLVMQLFGTVFLDSESRNKEKELSSGIMFGYAYEGHTYDFPKPKIMLVPSQPLVGRIPNDDSGYNKKFDEGYRVWLVDKLDQCVEVEVNQGFVDEIVLEANLPGKRSPTMYGAKMALAHRSGRLTE